MTEEQFSRNDDESSPPNGGQENAPEGQDAVTTPETDDSDWGYDPAWVEANKGAFASPTRPIEDPQVIVNYVPVTVTDLDTTLAASMPTTDTPTDELVRIAGEWHKTLIAVGRKTVVMAWRIGRVLRLLRDRAESGTWEKFVKANLAPQGISLSTVKRYIRLSVVYEDEKDVESFNGITDAYEFAGIVTPAKTRADTVVDALERLAEDVTRFLNRSRTFLWDSREWAPDILRDEDYSDRDEVLKVFQADIQLLTAMWKLRNHLDEHLRGDRRIKFYDRAELLAEWMDKEIAFFDPLAWEALADIIPQGAISEDKRRWAAGVANAKRVQAEYNKEQPKQNIPKGMFNPLRYPDGPPRRTYPENR